MFISLCRNNFLNAIRTCRAIKRSKATKEECAKCANLFGDVQMGQPDPILSVSEAFQRDTKEEKVDLGVGAYRDDNGEPYVLPSVEEAEERVFGRQMDKEYSTIIGIPEFYEAAAKLALGEQSKVLCDKATATMQTISGTGAIRLGAEFLSKFWQQNREVYLPTPTWGNHNNIFEHTQLKTKTYRYYDCKTQGLDFEGFMEDICKMPKGSIILLHACAHNPTGVDPTTEQWCEVSQAIKEFKHYPFFDMAYQGFATGCIDRDAFAVRLFEIDCHQFAIAQSFSKNMGLYGERVGALTFVCANKDEAERMLSQAKILVRSLYSTPPLHGARIAAEILNDPDLYQVWLQDVKCMSQRIIDMRQELKNNLRRVGSKICWDHITSHIGMFCYTGMSEKHVECLARDHGVYATANGRISIAGLNSKNVEHVARAIHEVTKSHTVTKKK